MNLIQLTIDAHTHTKCRGKNADREKSRAFQENFGVPVVLAPTRCSNFGTDSVLAPLKFRHRCQKPVLGQPWSKVDENVVVHNYVFADFCSALRKFHREKNALPYSSAVSSVDTWQVHFVANFRFDCACLPFLLRISRVTHQFIRIHARFSFFDVRIVIIVFVGCLLIS